MAKGKFNINRVAGGEIAGDGVDQAKKLLEPLNAQEVVVQDIDSNVASLFEQEAEPTPEPEPAASASS